MAWHPSEEEITNVVSLSAEKRYEYFIHHVVDEESLWALWKDGWAIMGDSDGNEVFPIWPHQDFAALCANGAWDNYTPKVIELGVWMEKWLPGLQRDQRLVAVFPTPDNQGIERPPLAHREDLATELENY